jgi:hypothetical protein
MAAPRDDVLRKLNESQDAELRPLRVTPAQVARARAVVRARARDDADRQLLLDALGLSGVRPQRTGGSPQSVRAQAVHGMGGGVAAHKWLGEPLCEACDRWMDVHLRKGGAASPDCGTYAQYSAHVKAGQSPDDACKAGRRLYQADIAAQRRQASPAAVALEAGDA